MQVAVQSSWGNIVTTDSSTVTLTLNGGTFSTGGNTATATAVNGIATFGNLVINAMGTYTITASDGTDTSADKRELYHRRAGPETGFYATAY